MQTQNKSANHMEVNAVSIGKEPIFIYMIHFNLWRIPYRTRKKQSVVERERCKAWSIPIKVIKKIPIDFSRTRIRPITVIPLLTAYIVWNNFVISLFYIFKQLLLWQPVDLLPSRGPYGVVQFQSSIQYCLLAECLQLDKPVWKSPV